MIGAIIGDMVGSRFEGRVSSPAPEGFALFTERCRPTDDSVMTLAIAWAILSCGGRWTDLPAQAVDAMRRFGRHYPNAGYGRAFREWILSEDPKPYGSWGNGSAMRVSPCAWAAQSLEETIALSRAVTSVTHNHPEGIKGAEAVACAVYLARTGASQEAIRQHIESQYYKLDFTLDELRGHYAFSSSCQGSVPQAIEAFLESCDFEDAVRRAVGLGGDSDTIGAMAGSIAEAFWGVPDSLRQKALMRLDRDCISVLEAFEQVFPPKRA